MAYLCKTLIATEDDSSAQEKRLSICLGADGFSFSVTTASHNLLTFGQAEGAHATSITDATRDIKAFFAETGIRPLGFRTIEIIAVSDDATWVPDELYTSVANRSYLRLLGGNPSAVVSVPCKALGSTMVFAAPEHLVTAFKVSLPGAVVLNQHVLFTRLLPYSTSRPVIVAHWRCGSAGYAEKGRVDVAAMHEGKYLFGNSLRYSNVDEGIFQIVEVMKTYALDRPDTELLLCGDVDRDIYGRLRPYFATTTLYSGTATQFSNPEFKKLHTYRHALILM